MATKKPVRPIEKIPIFSGSSRNDLGKRSRSLLEGGNLPKNLRDSRKRLVKELSSLLNGVKVPSNQIKGDGELGIGILLTLLAHGESSLGYQYINLAAAIILTWMGDRSGDKDFYLMAKECARLALGFEQQDYLPKRNSQK